MFDLMLIRIYQFLINLAPRTSETKQMTFLENKEYANGRKLRCLMNELITFFSKLEYRSRHFGRVVKALAC